jgi:hypothetical protein
VWLGADNADRGLVRPVLGVRHEEEALLALGRRRRVLRFVQVLPRAVRNLQATHIRDVFAQRVIPVYRLACSFFLVFFFGSVSCELCQRGHMRHMP